MQRARDLDCSIVCALDTHLHNDFLSGGPELAAGGFGEYLRPTADSVHGSLVRDGDEIAIGSLQLRALHTPGHTPEHVSYLLLNGAQTPVLFSGGALMVGTIARPDLLGADQTFALSRMARSTVDDVLAPLADSVEVLPTHGAGSFCGSSSSTDASTTIGRERRENDLFRRSEFLDFLAAYSNQGEIPRYYRRMAPMNHAGPPLLGATLPALQQLDPEMVEGRLAQGAMLVDVRPHADFDGGFVPGAISTGAEGPMSAWLGWVLPPEQRLVLVAEQDDTARHARRMLIRIGMDAADGWMRFSDWKRSGRPVARMRRGVMAEVAQRIGSGDRLAVLDARQEREWVAGHVPGAVHAQPPAVLEAVADLPAGTLAAIHCSTGYRSALAASLLAREGRLAPWHIVDGVEEWRRLGLPLTRPG